MLDKQFLTFASDGPVELVEIGLGPHFCVGGRSIDSLGHSGSFPIKVALQQEIYLISLPKSDKQTIFPRPPLFSAVRLLSKHSSMSLLRLWYDMVKSRSMAIFMRIVMQEPSFRVNGHPEELELLPEEELALLLKLGALKKIIARRWSMKEPTA